MGIQEQVAPHLTVERMLSKLAAERPSETAIDHPEGKITFGELNQRVHKRVSEIATILDSPANAGVLPVIVNYGLGSLFDVIACLWLRHPFAPISSSSPPGRLDQYLTRLGEPSEILKSDSEHGESSLEDVAPPLGGSSLPVFLRSVDPNDTGAIMFTSGSTGQPKGVAIPWGTLDFRLADYFDTLGQNRLPLRFSSLAPLNVVSGLLQVFLLLNGATMVRRDPSVYSPVGLLNELSQSRITHLLLPSQVCRAMARVVEPEVTHFSECVLLSIGGESVRCEDLIRFRTALPGNAVFRHVLGATESMTYLSYSIPLGELPLSGQVPVSGPMIHATTRLVPVSDSLSEVWCTGPIASGYLEDDSLNLQAFHTDSDGIRWWKSGDLVSQDSEGNLIHQGRVDDLVKIRGKLASPSELIHHLLEIPGVSAALVMVGHSPGEMHFDAHVEVPDSALFSESRARAYLAQVLEPHFMPRLFVQWASFPVGPQGKADRLAMRSSLNLS